MDEKKGTVFYGGAGLDGEYIDDFVQAFIESGITNTVRGTSAPFSLGPFFDAALVIRMNDIIEGHGYPVADLDHLPHLGPQLNLIGYSYGALIAAQVAHAYTHHYKHDVDHLVLLAAPIEQESLSVLRNNPRIRSIIIVDLTQYGDPVFAGMSDWQISSSIYTLFEQQDNLTGHFYYAPMDQEGAARRRAFAKSMYARGLR